MFAREEIERCALSLGIDACGVAQADLLSSDRAYLEEWLQRGCHGTMEYMARNLDLREDITQLVPNCKTIVVCLFNYYKQEKQCANAPYIAQCGLSQEDYHIVVKACLQQLANKLKEEHPTCINTSYQHIFCDSAPVLERCWAQRAGLGWIGKNRLLIHPILGSFVHIGILLLQEECEQYATPTPNKCGECSACLKACPTGAIRGEYFDARKCVSYLTIERKEPLADKYRSLVWTLTNSTSSGAIYGCDTCQDACPYNQHLTETKHVAFRPNSQLLSMTYADWQQLSHRQRIKRLRRIAKD